MTTLNALHKTDLPTVVDFWAPWCIPCRTSKPVLERLAEEFTGQVDFQVINADENQELLQELKIFGIPTLLVLRDGNIIKRITGAQTPAYYRNLFSSLASGEEMELAGPSGLDRILRLGAGAAVSAIAFWYSVPWLLPLGLVIMFTGVYDRCPVWQAVSSRFKNSS
ncbi:MAG: thioredoxin fold domain-containing protein [Anaerolineales bacterium]|nr:thioredoxin fold domain-containing protein [Anaerolineales bacterium]